MGFSKGESGNPNGRPKGSTNKSTRELRAALRDVVEEELSSLAERLRSMPEGERLAVVMKLLPFVLPKLESTSESKEKLNDKLSFLDNVL